ncbi:hypothetical protein ZWY2020_023365 [Hordeum vulgare]|nr:hypothetical protein ZWY2020_023365 [Hordeum vulgare]
MSNGRISASGAPLKIFGTDIGYIWSASLGAKIPSRDSLLPFLSTALGYFIIAGSTVIKLPQILKILKHRSVRGLSVASFELELIGYTIALAYCIHKGLPFSAYGELAFLLIQAIILIGIIYYYSPPMGSKTWMKALLLHSMPSSSVLECRKYGKISQIRALAVELPDFFHELCWFPCKSFYQHPGEDLLSGGNLLPFDPNFQLWSGISSSSCCVPSNRSRRLEEQAVAACQATGAGD